MSVWEVLEQPATSASANRRRVDVFTLAVTLHGSRRTYLCGSASTYARERLTVLSDYGVLQ